MIIPAGLALVGYHYHDQSVQLEAVSKEIGIGHNHLLRAFRIERDFFSFDQRNPEFFETGSSAYLREHEQWVRAAQNSLSKLTGDQSQDIQPQIVHVTQLLKAYTQQLALLAELLLLRGFEDHGAVGNMRRFIHDMDESIESAELRVHLLMLRRHEKDYIIRNQSQYVEKLRQRSAQFQEALRDAEGLATEERTRLLNQLDAYESAFNTLVDIDTKIGLRSGTAHYGELARSEKALTSAYQELQNTIVLQSADKLERLLERFGLAIFVIGLIAAGLGLYLSQSMTRPLMDLETSIHKFIKSDFDKTHPAPIALSMNDEVGRIASAFMLLQDKLRGHVVSLREQTRAADKANKAKGDFLANMSHEIRTPLNGVIGMAQLLDEGTLSDDQKECAEVINHSAQSLLAIVNDILDFSKIEAGCEVVEQHAFDIVSSAQQTLASFQPQAAEKSISLSINHEGVDTPWLVGDQAKFQQVLRNLVSNAIKFTSLGNVIVSLNTQKNRTDGGVVLHLTVADTGVGIEPSALEKIFDAFGQADSSTTRRYGGTGLGLTICKRLTKLMGGDLNASSTPGNGSLFSATFAMQIGECADERETQPTFDKSLSVLLVEDNPLNQKIALKMLTRLGIQPDVAGDGKAAIEAFLKNQHSLILMDIQMPIMDGLTATRTIRAMENVSQPRIIALTANVTEGDREACLDAGMQGFVSKPISMTHLDQALSC